MIDPFEREIGREVLGNHPASGTEIIAELGEEHLRTGRPIVYTSGDSVFQIATHKEVVDLATLYEWSRVARRLLMGPHAVGRVIACPFDGEPGAFVRSPERRDFSLRRRDRRSSIDCRTPGPRARVGKIRDIFSGQGITEGRYSDSNDHGVDLTLEYLARPGPGVRVHEPRGLRLEVGTGTTRPATPPASRRSTAGCRTCSGRSTAA